MSHRSLCLAQAAAAVLAASSLRAQDSTAVPASAPPTATVVAARPAHPPRRDRELITAEEMGTRTETDAFTLIYAARPAWLRARGQSYLRRSETIQVYINGIRSGDPSVLRQIQVHNILSIQHLDSTLASSRFGADHGLGAILVTLR